MKYGHYSRHLADAVHHARNMERSLKVAASLAPDERLKDECHALKDRAQLWARAIAGRHDRARRS